MSRALAPEGRPGPPDPWGYSTVRDHRADRGEGAR